VLLVGSNHRNNVGWEDLTQWHFYLIKLRLTLKLAVHLINDLLQLLNSDIILNIKAPGLFEVDSIKPLPTRKKDKCANRKPINTQFTGLQKC
jgi:hypothetical protein